MVYTGFHLNHGELLSCNIFQPDGYSLVLQGEIDVCLPESVEVLAASLIV